MVRSFVKRCRDSRTQFTDLAPTENPVGDQSKFGMPNSFPDSSSRPSWACGLMTWRPLMPRTHFAIATSRSHSFAGQLTGLLHPGDELSFVELVVLVDVEVAHVLLLGLTGRDGTQRRAAKVR